MEKVSPPRPSPEDSGTLATTSSSSVNVTNGYDYELLGGDARYECPICLCYLRNPIITLCGHRFCIECISKWMINAGGACPVCGNGQRLEMENIFPDNYTRREIMQCKAKCPFEGCSEILSVSELDVHIKKDHKNQTTQTQAASPSKPENGSPTSSGLIECVYKEVGCFSYFTRDQLNKHLEADVNHHLQLLTAAYRRLRVVFSSRPILDYPPPQELFLRQDSRESGNSTRWLLADETMDSTMDEYQFRRQRSWDSVRFARRYHCRSRFPERLAESDESLSCSKGSSSDQQPHHGHGHGQAMVPAHGGSSSAQNASFNQQMHELFERVVRLEQSDNEKQITINRLQAQLAAASAADLPANASASLNATRLENEKNWVSRFCNGIFVWRIPGIKKICLELRQNPLSNRKSDGFYTSTFGYKMCICLKLFSPSTAGAAALPPCLPPIEKDEETTVALHLHLMPGENDDTIRWPFRGEIKIMIVNATFEDSVVAEMIAKPGIPAFVRPNPNVPISAKGWGFDYFCPVNKIFTDGFIHKNDTLVIKTIVKEA